jgi:hypothetical protein
MMFVRGNLIAIVQPLANNAKMNNRKKLGKPCLLSLAKGKEKQSNLTSQRKVLSLLLLLAVHINVKFPI